MEGRFARMRDDRRFVVGCGLLVGCNRAFGRKSMEDGRPLRYVDLVDYDDWVD